MAPSDVFAGVGGYYASKQGGLAGVFRCAADGSDWKHALSEVETFTVFVHPHDPNLVLPALPMASIAVPIAVKISAVPTFPIKVCRSGHSCLMMPIRSGCWPAARP